ncbi:MAG: phospholipid/cholesterol/gamma-HCH transport system substrate-binding protein [Gemmatimonadaceae bacterium]|jgi:phospholipid/cholesterol/gamma-HCH transport system substrate-binding protein|nr:phospholipid/cholesterol/gamma-HCH transport system substrate-binding protein [Gemmatimonadaceae bacterium]MEA2764419.1 phospholipid/cholesterol/gamma-HCH transport system substrate-binding protein [Gemmatimonadaceae bacterium]
MKTRDEVLVGLIVTAAIVVTVLGSLWLARGGLSKGYPLYAKFPWGAGLKQGQPVLLVGVNVGYVDQVDLHQNGTLVTTLRIQKDYKVPVTSKATVVPNGIFGDMAIAVTPSRPDPRSFKPGDTIPIGPSTPGIAELTSKADSITRSVNAMTSALEHEMVAGGGIRDLRNTISATNRMVNEFAAVASEQSRQLTATMTSLRRATSAIDPAKVDSTITNFRSASANLAAMSTDLKQTTSKLDAILAKVDSGNGSAAKLLNDPGVYNDVRQLLQRMDSLVADIKKNPKRYINVKVF